MEIDYPSKHVLVVDDHPGMRASIRATLGNFGVVRTDLASNAQEATRRVRQEPYDIIISDYHLGEGRDGQQLLEELRHARLIPPSTVFLMVTQAGATLKTLRAHYPNDPKAEFAALVVESLKETRAGNANAAAAAVDKALALNAAHALAQDEGMTLDLARACLGAGREQEGKSLVTRLVHSNHEDGALLDKARNLFAEIGRPEDGERLVRESIQAAVTLNNRAVRMAQQGDIAGAVDLLAEAARELPDNVLIQLNTAHALLTLIQQRGWDADLATRARDHLTQAKQRNAEHPKLAKVIGLFRDLAKQHGVMN